LSKSLYVAVGMLLATVRRTTVFHYDRGLSVWLSCCSCASWVRWETMTTCVACAVRLAVDT